MPAQNKETDSLTVMDVVKVVAATLMVLAGVAGSGWWLYKSTQPEPSHPLMAEITLDNRCGLINEAFMAVSEPDGRKVYFEGNRAILPTRSNAQIYVRSSDRYPAFYYESPRVDAAKKLTITATCDRGERINRTLDALRDQFKTDNNDEKQKP